MVTKKITVISSSNQTTVYKIGSKKYTFTFGDDGRLNSIECDSKISDVDLLKLISQPILSWDNMKPWSVPKHLLQTLTSTGTGQQIIDFTIPDGTVWKVLAWSAENLDRYLNCSAYCAVQGMALTGGAHLFSGLLSMRSNTWGLAMWAGVIYSRKKVGTGFYNSQVGDRLMSTIMYQEANE